MLTYIEINFYSLAINLKDTQSSSQHFICQTSRINPSVDICNLLPKDCNDMLHYYSSHLVDDRNYQTVEYRTFCRCLKMSACFMEKKIVKILQVTGGFHTFLTVPLIHLGNFRFRESSCQCRKL